MSETEQKYGYSVCFQFVKQMTHPTTGKSNLPVAITVHEIVVSTEKDGQRVLWEKIREKWPQESELIGYVTPWHLCPGPSVIELGWHHEQ